MKPENDFLNEILEQFDQIKKIWDENERLRATARMVLLGLFIIVIVGFAAIVLSRTDAFITGLLPPTAVPSLTPVPTITMVPTPTIEPTPGPSPTPTEAPPPTPPEPKQPGFLEKNLRYIIVPFIAFIMVIIGSAKFIQDVYALKQFRQGLKYVFTSLTGLLYPKLIIDSGKIQLKEEEYNPIDVIGGPGYVIVQPGNAVLLRRLRHPSKITINRTIFLRRFETIGQIANLDDQHNSEKELEAVTKDGIKVIVRDINYRFRIISSSPRNLNNAYPFDVEAFDKMAYERAVGPFGLPDWRANIHMLVKTALTQYIASHTIDYLTAPRENGQQPRREMREYMLSKQATFSIRGAGAELLWIDVGHIDIEKPEVDKERINYWAADWVGDAESKRAYADAKREAYIDIGRAEAQAEMIMGIANALQENGADLLDEKNDNLENIILARTAKILDILTETKKNDDNS